MKILTHAPPGNAHLTNAKKTAATMTAIVNNTEPTIGYMSATSLDQATTGNSGAGGQGTKMT